jgi:hypothetical protein
MNPKFERFLKETKQDILKKERLEKKAQRESLKQEKLAAKEKEKEIKKLAREEAKAEKLRQKLAKQEEKRLAKEAKLLGKQTGNTGKKKKSQDQKVVSWDQNDLFATNEATVAPTTKTQPEELRPEQKDEDLENKTLLVVESPKEVPDEQNSQIPVAKENKSLAATQKEESNEPRSLFEMFKSEGDYQWLQPDSLAAKGAFNLINKYLHSDRHLAKGVAILPIKGTSFEDKRVNCLKFLSEVSAGESTGEIYLKPEPQNPFDSNAVAVYDMKNNAMLGYIPKAHEINACYAKSLEEGKFCGGYIIEGKNSMLKGEENAMILIATGWI